MTVTGPANDQAPLRRPRPWLRLTVVLLMMAILAAGMIGFHRFKAGILKTVTAQIQSEQPTVSTAIAEAQPWQPTLTVVGSMRASNGADLSPELGGVIDDITFESGQYVAAGTILLQLRLDDDSAKLQQLAAAADLDSITYRRDLRQLQSQGVAQATVDSDAGDLKVALAQVAGQKAMIDEKTIRAPFSGRLGIRQVDLGQYIAAGTTVVTLQALNPMFIDFYLPQRAIGQIALGQRVTVSVDSFPGRNFVGAVSSLNSKVDPASRMLQVRATIPNPDNALLPGMFATAAVAVGQPQSLVTIPQTAVTYNPYGSSIYVIQRGRDSQGRAIALAHQQFVVTGATRGDQVSIVSGVDPADTVVTSGQIKLHNDVPVKIDNSAPMTDAAAPVPQDN